MAVDKEAISLSRVYSHYSKCTCPYYMCNPRRMTKLCMGVGYDYANNVSNFGGDPVNN